MKTFVRDCLATLGPISKDESRVQARSCKMCRGHSPLFTSVDFLKHCHPEHPYAFGKAGISVDYYRCENCECAFTDFFDDWTPDDFSRFVYNDDYIKVDDEYPEIRPRRTALHQATAILDGAEHMRFLDYGSGSGAFAAEMQLHGFADFNCYDPFSQPVRPVRQYDVVTAFEVIEHSADPRAVLADMLGFVAPGGCLIIGQTLQPADIADLRGDWWYLGPRNGHATTFSARTLEIFADSHGLEFHEGAALFALAAQPLSESSRRILQKISVPIHRPTFFAPTDMIENYAGWHTPEYDAGRAFRWTAQSEIVLGFHRFERGIHRVRVPLFQEMYNGFRLGCRIRIGSVEHNAVPRGGMIEAEFRFDQPYGGPVILHTPPTMTPFQRDGIADYRELGMAVFCDGPG